MNTTETKIFSEEIPEQSNYDYLTISLLNFVISHTHNLVSLTCLLLCFLVFYFCWLPTNKFYDLEDQGKLNATQKVHKRRKLGDMPPSYPNGWFALIESESLKNGQVQHISLLGENFAVFRGNSGVVYIFDAYCPHLGANLAVGGTVRGDCLECPFHKWTFKGSNGSCVSVPYSRNIPDFAKAKTWPCSENNGFIFVWYHAEGTPPSWHIEKNECIDQWKFHGRTEFLVHCHIQDIPENGADVGHLTALHGASLLGGYDLNVIETPILHFMRHSWEASWEASTNEPHKGLLTLKNQTILWNRLTMGLLNLKIQQIGPAYVELAIQAPWGPMLLLQSVTPIAPLKQKVVHRIYAPWWAAPLSKLTLWAETIMFSRDVYVWNHKCYISKPILVKEDKYLGRHRRWYNQFYSLNSKCFTFKEENALNW